MISECSALKSVSYLNDIWLFCIKSSFSPKWYLTDSALSHSSTSNSHNSPVKPCGHEHVFGAAQVPPFSHRCVQIAGRNENIWAPDKVLDTIFLLFFYLFSVLFQPCYKIIKHPHPCSIVFHNDFLNLAQHALQAERKIHNESKKSREVNNCCGSKRHWELMWLSSFYSNKAGYTAWDAFSLILIVVLVKNGTFAWFQLVCDGWMD